MGIAGRWRDDVVGMDVRGGLDWPRENDVRLGDEAAGASRFMQTRQRISLACIGRTIEF